MAIWGDAINIRLWWFNLAASSYTSDSHLLAARISSLIPPAPSVGWGGEWTKSETHGLRYRQFNKTTKRILLLKNMQNMRYTIQVFSLPDDQLHSLPLRRDHGACGSHRTLPPLARPHLYAECDICGMKSFCCPAQVGCLAMPPPSSCTPAH